MHRGVKSKVCPEPDCQFACTNQSNLRSHIYRAHTKPEDIKWNVCPKAECGKRFKRADKLKIHMNLHHDGTMKYVCEEEGCTKAYVSHTPSAQFKCAQCGRHFIDKLKLDRHSSVHTGENRYPCTLCEKSYRHHESWLQHQSVHTGVNRWLCSVCGYRTAYSSPYRAHMAKCRPEIRGGGSYLCPEEASRFISAAKAWTVI